ncbi:hypothetical protein BCR33DRAFT_744100 [Rhizoclosmatium globosum]|uniref:Uncharacterized protein n=1 Tax=Rhizoclosmatium globosum TaxID=329046 RepID=A0A1Y2BC76_9FUNG|nr:hypothetical protein BCR33DRAFT_744100 [Rhizoclosmatium globosum]|eukprot:ORY32442.1 hypothetical protein BCR33DRAFT_744100 [Rhizoclosmatium globosum]
MCANLGADVGLFVTCVNDLCGPAKDLKSKDDLWKTVSALNLIPDNCSILLNKKVVYSFSQNTDQTGIIAKDENGKLVAGSVTTSTSTTTSTKTTGTTTATTTAAAVVNATPARTTTIVKTTAKAQTNIVVSGASETIMFSIIGFVFSVFMV